MRRQQQAHGRKNGKIVEMSGYCARAEGLGGKESANVPACDGDAMPTRLSNNRIRESANKRWAVFGGGSSVSLCGWLSEVRLLEKVQQLRAV